MSDDSARKQPTEDEDLFEDETEEGSGVVIVGAPPAPKRRSEASE